MTYYYYYYFCYRQWILNRRAKIRNGTVDVVWKERKTAWITLRINGTFTVTFFIHQLYTGMTKRARFCETGRNSKTASSVVKQWYWETLKNQCHHDLSAIVPVSRLLAVNKHTVVQALTNCRNNDTKMYSLANTAVVERPRLAMKGRTVLKSAEAPLKVAILMVEDNLDSPQRRTFAWEIIRHCRAFTRPLTFG